MSASHRQWWLGPVLAFAAAVLAACGDDSATAVTPNSPFDPSGSASGVAASETAAAPAAPSVLYVANTGGTGVAARNRCEDAARTGGSGLAEAAEVRVVATPADQCGGWTLVDANGTTNWVRNEYLSKERPAVVAAPPRGPAPVAPPTGGGPVPVSPPPAVRLEKVLVYFEHLIPLSQLEYRSAAFSQILMTPSGPTPGAYICPAYNYSAPTARTTTGLILQNPDPMGCGFARADTAVIREVAFSQ